MRLTDIVSVWAIASGFSIETCKYISEANFVNVCLRDDAPGAGRCDVWLVFRISGECVDGAERDGLVVGQ